MSIKLMTAVWEIEELKDNRKLVLLCLADHANDDGLCWPSEERLAKRTGVSDRTVRRILRDLEDEGRIEVVEPGGGRSKTNLFRVINPDTMSGYSQNGASVNPDTDDRNPDIDDRNPDIDDRNPDIDDRNPDIAVSGEPPIEPPQEPSNEPKPPQPRAAVPSGKRGSPRTRGSGGGGLAGSDIRRVFEEWEKANFRLTPLVQEHLRKWMDQFGADEVLEAISIAGLSEPDAPGKFVWGVLQKRREDQAREEAIEKRTAELREEQKNITIPASAGAGSITKSTKKKQEPQAVVVLREIGELAEAEMKLVENGDGEGVQVMVRDVEVAEKRLRRLTRRTLGSAGLGEVKVEFVAVEA